MQLALIIIRAEGLEREYRNKEQEVYAEQYQRDVYRNLGKAACITAIELCTRCIACRPLLVRLDVIVQRHKAQRPEDNDGYDQVYEAVVWVATPRCPCVMIGYAHMKTAMWAVYES